MAGVEILSSRSHLWAETTRLMGFDIGSFTPIFVMSRITGWTAHIMEQAASNALIRPLSAYSGREQRALAQR